MELCRCLLSPQCRLSNRKANIEIDSLLLHIFQLLSHSLYSSDRSRPLPLAARVALAPLGKHYIIKKGKGLVPTMHVGPTLSLLWCPYIGRAMWCGSLGLHGTCHFQTGHRRVEIGTKPRGARRDILYSNTVPCLDAWIGDSASNPPTYFSKITDIGNIISSKFEISWQFIYYFIENDKKI